MFFEDYVAPSKSAILKLNQTFNVSEFFLFQWISVVVLCCVKRVNLRLAKRSLHFVFWAKIPLGGWKGYVINEWESCTFSCVTPITVWVASKNESNCLSENKMVSTLIWRHVSLLYVVQSNILWLTILLSYHYRCNVVFTNYRFPVSFLLYIATQKNLTKSLL